MSRRHFEPRRRRMIHWNYAAQLGGGLDFEAEAPVEADRPVVVLDDGQPNITAAAEPL